MLNQLANQLAQQNVSRSSAPTLAPTPPTFRSKKLPDVIEYDSDIEKLDAWEQGLIHKMNANHDRYPLDTQKIAYDESRLTIRKKAHNLIG